MSATFWKCVSAALILLYLFQIFATNKSFLIQVNHPHHGIADYERKQIERQ